MNTLSYTVQHAVRYVYHFVLCGTCHAHALGMCVHIVYTCVCTSVCAYVHPCARTCTCARTCSCALMNPVCTFVRLCLHLCVQLCVSARRSRACAHLLVRFYVRANMHVHGIEFCSLNSATVRQCDELAQETTQIRKERL